MCGIPYHAADTYVGRLIRRGFKVAICDQVEDAKQAKGIVKREVVRVVTPSTYLHQGYLEAKEPSYLMAIATGKHSVGAALADLSTGDFVAFQFDSDDRWQKISETLSTYRPREVLHPHGTALPDDIFEGLRSEGDSPVTTERDPWRFEHEASRSLLLRQFGTLSLEGYGLEDKPSRNRRGGRSTPIPRRNTARRARPHLEHPLPRRGRLSDPRSGHPEKSGADALADRKADGKEASSKFSTGRRPPWGHGR